MSEVSYKAVVNTALAEIGYQGSFKSSKYSADLDKVKFYNYPKQGSVFWCAIFYDWCVSILIIFLTSHICTAIRTEVRICIVIISVITKRTF